MLTTPGGRAFLRLLGGEAADGEIADDYVKVLTDTGVTGYPYVQATAHPQPGSEAAPLGVRVDSAKLLDTNAYLISLQAPRGTMEDAIRSRAGVSCSAPAPVRTATTSIRARRCPTSSCR